SGNLIAGFTPAQMQAFNSVNQNQGAYAPYLNAASQYTAASTAPLMNGVPQFNGQTVAGFESPYNQDVINATLGTINEQNAQQQNQLRGNAISAGALGGDRAGIAAAALAGQQDLAKNQTIAGLNNQNYAQALAELNNQQQLNLGANTAQAQLASQAGYQMG